MFDIGWSELLVIGVVAIVVVGPKELPRLMRAFGTYTGRARRMAADFQRQFEDAVRDSELDEVRKAMHEFRAEASSTVGLHNPIDTPLMLPKQEPSTPAVGAPSSPSPEPRSKPKPRAKRTTKAAPAKATSSAPKPRTKSETKSAPPKSRKPRERKP